MTGPDRFVPPTPDQVGPDHPPAEVPPGAPAVEYGPAAEAAFVTVAAWARLLHLEPTGLPRLCTAAACSAVEHLVEAYHRRLDQRHTGTGPPMSPQEIQDRQRQIVDATADLIDALEEGLTAAHKIRRAIVASQERG